MNRSILFPLYLLRMTKKMDYFLPNFVRREREWFPGSISIQFLAFIGMILGEFAFDSDRYPKSFTFSCYACSWGWSSGTSVSLLCESITNEFDPWEIWTQEWVLSLLRDQILISTPCLPYKQLVVTSSTGPIFVSLDPSSWLWRSIISWKSVFTTGHWIKLFSSIFGHETLSNFNHN